jgi:hypothetical protein
MPIAVSNGHFAQHQIALLICAFPRSSAANRFFGFGFAFANRQLRIARYNGKRQVGGQLLARRL